MGLDIGPKTIAKFKDILKDAKTVVWNGPMGAFEMPNFAEGTLEVGRALADLTDATTIIGGGDSTAAAKQLGIAPKISHISTVVVLHLTTLKVKYCQVSLAYKTSNLS